jgi:hypothetical protein
MFVFAAGGVTSCVFGFHGTERHIAPAAITVAMMQ